MTSKKILLFRKNEVFWKTERVCNPLLNLANSNIANHAYQMVRKYANLKIFNSLISIYSLFKKSARTVSLLGCSRLSATVICEVFSWGASWKWADYRSIERCKSRLLWAAATALSKNLLSRFCWQLFPCLCSSNSAFKKGMMIVFIPRQVKMSFVYICLASSCLLTQRNAETKQ